MKILLPVDGTELSLHETRFALRLVQDGLRASFVLANVQEPASFYETAVVTGDPAHAMLELIELRACDMVVMGSRALGPLRRMLEGGSTSRRLLDDCPVPVLLVKPPVAADPDMEGGDAL